MKNTITYFCCGGKRSCPSLELIENGETMYVLRDDKGGKVQLTESECRKLMEDLLRRFNSEELNV